MNQNTECIGVALFGIGRAGSIHFKNLLSNTRCRLRFIVEMDTDMALTLVTQYHLQQVKVISMDEAQQVYEDSSVDAVMVCSPTFTHDKIVLSALEHGKAVFCEKPVSESIEGTHKCYQAAEKAGKPLLCSYNRRFDPSARNIHSRVSAGEIGKIHVVKTCSRDHPVPSLKFLKISGGFFHDCACHDLDMVCWVVGEFPVSVFVQAHVHDELIAGLNDVDTAVIVMKFSSGVISITDLSRHATYGYDQRLEVNGSLGMLTSENQVPHGVACYSEEGIKGSVYKHSFPQRYAESYINAIEHFFNVIQGKEEAVVNKMDAVNVTVLASACEESLRTGSSVTVKYR